GSSGCRIARSYGCVQRCKKTFSTASVNSRRALFGAGKMALEGLSRSIRFADRVDVQYDPRDLAPIGTFRVRIQHTHVGDGKKQMSSNARERLRFPPRLGSARQWYGLKRPRHSSASELVSPAAEARCEDRDAAPSNLAERFFSLPRRRPSRR